MEEINLLDLLKYFKSKILILIIIFIGVFASSYLYFSIMDETLYKSEATLLVVDDNQATIDDENNIYVYSKYLDEVTIETNIQILKSDRILNKVIENLDLKISTQDLRNNLEVGQLEDSEIIEVIFSNKKSDNVYEIVDEIVNVYSDEVKSIYKAKSVKILNDPSEVISFEKIGLTKTILLSSLIAFVISFGSLFLVYLLKEVKKDM